VDDARALKYWIALKWVDSLGNIGMKALLNAFGSPRAIFEAPRPMLSVIPGIGKVISGNIKNFSDWARVEREVELAHSQKVSIITYDDPLFPEGLKNIYDCPMYLYVKGKLTPDDINLAVVGSRRASTYGKYATEKLSRELSLKGITVVSGMARGIDASAHKGAIAARGRTIAILGSGIDVIYPPEHKELYAAIQEHGAVVTEFPFGTPPNAPNFPSRNRIISGMSLGVVIVEASDKSGSLITARIALEQGREVFAIPGSIDSPGSRGTHQLIKEGATLVENVDDILPVIFPQVATLHRHNPPMTVVKPESPPSAPRESKKDFTALVGLNPTAKMIMDIICDQPVHIDTIIQSSQLKPADVLNALLTLELNGLIRQMPGKMYTREEQI
jgi:DNA processing protein